MSVYLYYLFPSKGFFKIWILFDTAHIKKYACLPKKWIISFFTHNPARTYASVFWNLSLLYFILIVGSDDT